MKFSMPNCFAITSLFRMSMLWMVFLSITLAGAQAKQVQKDVKGSRDHPVLGRYDGSFIIGYAHKKYSDFTLPLSGPANWNQAPEKTKKVEGRHTRILYVAPKDRSTLEIFRNYEKELKDKGAEILFSCEKGGCGKKDGLVMVRQLLYPQNAKLKNMGQVSEMAFSSPVEMRYMAAKVTGPATAYVSVFIAVETFNHFKETYSRALVLLDIVENKAMEDKMVVVPAGEMAKALDKKGAFSLYGIYFDTGSSVLKPESRDTLVQIGKMMAADPSLKLYIVGHTDNAGAFDYNLQLSQQRAQAVGSALVKDHHVPGSRLSAYGVGMLAPKASNGTDEGRRLNRRVELVKQ